MAVYHFTLHAYRSWRPDNPRGYTKRGEGYQAPDPEKAYQYDANANFSEVVFETTHQEIIILGTYDICRRRGWKLHALGSDPTHVHMVVSWAEYNEWRQVMEKLKNILSLLLGRAFDEPGRKWFVVGGSRKQVKNRKHFDYLLNTYLPDHPGIFWREGRPLPEDRFGILIPPSE